MAPLQALLAWVAGRFERPLPADAGAPRWQEDPPGASEPGSDEARRSIREVTLEQLGIAHWSCHTHF